MGADEDDEGTGKLKRVDELPLPGLAELLGANERGQLHGLRPGMVIDGKWQLQACLGKGSFGTVYEAWHLKLNHPAAIKFLVGNRKDAKRRFLEEAQLMAGLSSEHLVRASDYGELPDGSPYFVMDLVKGKSLRHWLSNGRFPMWRAVEIGAEIIEGLVEIHRRGVVHGDIKPENVVIGDDDNKARVLDFGLAQTSAVKAEERGGTPHYMAPEMLFDEASPSVRTDVYAVGVVLYEMVTRRLPRGHLNMKGFSEIKAAWESKPSPNPVRMYCKDVPEAQREALEALDKLVVKALARDPAERPKSAVPMLEELRRLRKRLSPEAIAPTLPAKGGGDTLVAEVKPRAPFILIVATIAIGGILVAAALTTFVLEWRFEPVADDTPFREEAEIPVWSVLTVPHVEDKKPSTKEATPAEQVSVPEARLEQSGSNSLRGRPSKKSKARESKLRDVRKMMERGDWHGAEVRIRDLMLEHTSADLSLLLAEVYIELDAVKNRKLIEGELGRVERSELSRGQAKRLEHLRQRVE